MDENLFNFFPLSTLTFYSMHNDPACSQSFSTVRDARFEPEITASDAMRNTNELPHLHVTNHSNKIRF